MEHTERGFAMTEPFETRYHGEMRVQQSSSINRSIWVFPSKAYSNNPTTSPKPNLHLSYLDAKKLHDELGKMIDYMESSD